MEIDVFASYRTYLPIVILLFVVDGKYKTNSSDNNITFSDKILYFPWLFCFKLYELGRI